MATKTIILKLSITETTTRTKAGDRGPGDTAPRTPSRRLPSPSVYCVLRPVTEPRISVGVKHSYGRRRRMGTRCATEIADKHTHTHVHYTR